jgi:hypothetical protein
LFGKREEADKRNAFTELHVIVGFVFAEEKKAEVL